MESAPRERWVDALIDANGDVSILFYWLKKNPSLLCDVEEEIAILERNVKKPRLTLQQELAKKPETDDRDAISAQRCSSRTRSQTIALQGVEKMEADGRDATSAQRRSPRTRSQAHSGFSF